MKAPIWQRYRKELNKYRGQRGKVVSGCNGLYLVKLNSGEQVLLPAIASDAVLSAGAEVALVLRRHGDQVADEPIAYTLKLQKV